MLLLVLQCFLELLGGDEILFHQQLAELYWHPTTPRAVDSTGLKS
jgi:hypothetical protein